MRRQDRLFWLTVGLAIVVVLIAVVFLLRQNQPAQTAAQGLTITNSDQYSNQLDFNSIDSVETAINRRLTDSGKSGSYAGTIRQGSFHVNYTYSAGQRIPVTTYIVDIPAAKQSYVVTISGGTGYQFNILHVTCPSSHQLKYGSFDCHDEEQ